jgi:hypothetical protein
MQIIPLLPCDAVLTLAPPVQLFLFIFFLQCYQSVTAALISWMLSCGRMSRAGLWAAHRMKKQLTKLTQSSCLKIRVLFTERCAGALQWKPSTEVMKAKNASTAEKDPFAAYHSKAIGLPSRTSSGLGNVVPAGGVAQEGLAAADTLGNSARTRAACGHGPAGAWRAC